MRFFIYDTETTGKDVRFDQIIQYAGITTDDSLVPDDSFEVRCRPDVHVLPHPAALVVTKNRWSRLTGETLSHYQMMRQVSAKLKSLRPAIFLGHNILRFDEEIERQALYKTLEDPYLTSKPGCGRIDSLYVMRLAKLIAPDQFSWPTYEDGRPSFKLEDLAPANGIDEHNAHDALGDVIVCGQMMALVRRKAPEVWDCAMRGAFKDQVESVLKKGKPFLLMADRGEAKLRVVVPIARNPGQASENYLLDLDLGVETALAAKPEDVCMAGGGMVRMRSNRMPLILPLERLGAHAVQHYELAAAEATKNTALFQKAMDAVKASEARFTKSDYIEDKIYDGFFDRRDELERERFHDAAPGAKLETIRRFQDKRLQNIGHRLMHLEWRDAQPAEMTARKDKALAARMESTEEVPWMTRPRALEETEKMLAEGAHEGEKLDILVEYRDALRAMTPEVVPA